MNKKLLPKTVKNLTICVLGLSLLSACSQPEQSTLEVVTTPIAYSRPIVPKVNELELKQLNWIIITEGTFQNTIDTLRAQGREPVLYALTSTGYVNFIYNQTDIIKLIRQQKRIIAAYENWQYWEKY
jgi:hypothetical protein